jgi:hypothetical protein
VALVAETLTTDESSTEAASAGAPDHSIATTVPARTADTDL